MTLWRGGQRHVPVIKILLELVEKLPTLLHARGSILFRLLSERIVDILIELRSIRGIG